MILVKDNKIYKPNENPFLFSAENFDAMSKLDEGFHQQANLIFSTPFQVKKKTKANPRLIIHDSAGGEVFYVDRGLTVLIGSPGSGKSTFVTQSLIPSGFKKYDWGEPDSGLQNQSITALLNHLTLITECNDDRSGVIDSIMPLIISSDDNLGQGGLSKRVLSYLRQLSAISWHSGGHIVLTMNPLEEGPVLYTWINYVKAVTHSVCVIENKKAYLSSRLPIAHARVLIERKFGGATGNEFLIPTSTSQFPKSYDSIVEQFAGITTDNANTKSVSQSGSALKVEPTFGNFPKM